MALQRAVPDKRRLLQSLMVSQYGRCLSTIPRVVDTHRGRAYLGAPPCGLPGVRCCCGFVRGGSALQSEWNFGDFAHPALPLFFLCLLRRPTVPFQLCVGPARREDADCATEEGPRPLLDLWFHAAWFSSRRCLSRRTNSSARRRANSARCPRAAR